MWAGINALINEIKKCEGAGAAVSAVAMAYVCIDTMTFLSLPANRNTQGKKDFILWVDTYLQGHPDQLYQYRGIDVYGARCAVLHAFSSDVHFHEENADAKKFGYHDGGKHGYDPKINDHLVIIGTASFINDVIHAISAFIEACKANPAMRQQVESRLPTLLATFPFKV